MEPHYVEREAEERVLKEGILHPRFWYYFAHWLFDLAKVIEMLHI